MLTQRAPLLHLKALTGDEDEPGTFEAIVAVFDNVDLYGEVVLKGAFAESFAADWPKVCWSHRWAEPPIGVTKDIKEVTRAQIVELIGVEPKKQISGGVYAKGRLFVAEGEDSPYARQVWTALKAVDGQGVPALDEFSYHYQPIEGGIVDRDGERVYEIRKASMTEWGPCLKGVNPDTELLTVKADGLAQRERELPGYDPAEITAAKALQGNPAPNAAEAAEEARARTLKAHELMLERPLDLA
jgi:uncharacterized protein